MAFLFAPIAWLVGFGSAGVGRATLAARVQSLLYGGMVPGVGLFPALQSIGATATVGRVLAGGLAIATGSTVAVSALAPAPARHTGRAAPHVCEKCGKGFYQADDLARHMRAHSGEVDAKAPPAKVGLISAASLQLISRLLKTCRSAETCRMKFDNLSGPGFLGVGLGGSC